MESIIVVVINSVIFGVLGGIAWMDVATLTVLIVILSHIQTK